MNNLEKIDEYLSNNGYPHHIDEDGDIVIKYIDSTIICSIHEDDEMYIHFYMPNIYSVDIEETEDDEEPQPSDYYLNVLKICNYITDNIKTVKAVIANNNVHLSVEQFIDPNSNFEELTKRILHLLKKTRQKFYDLLPDDNE